MNRGTIGVQLSTIKDKLNELGGYGIIKACAELGYRCVEISQIPMTNANVINMKKACDDYGIKVAACTASLEPIAPGVPGEYLVSDFDKIVSDCKTMETDMLRIGIIPVTSMGSREKTLEFAKRAEEMAERLGEYGIDLYFHSHHVEFVKYDGQYQVDIIKNATRKLGFELDTYWIQAGGENPVSFIESYAGRIRLLHLKDYRIAEIKLPDLPYDTSTVSQIIDNQFVTLPRFAEVGEGNLPIKECIETGLTGGCEYFLVEQDDTYEIDSLESLRISRDNLIALGYRDWFNK